MFKEEFKKLNFFK